jgi:hypothetical protein
MSAVNHPLHYNKHPSGIECIDVIDHMHFCLGNAIKYLWRSEHKAKAIEDTEKAIWYVSREIERRERILCNSVAWANHFLKPKKSNPAAAECERVLEFMEGKVKYACYLIWKCDQNLIDVDGLKTARHQLNLHLSDLLATQHI